MRWAILLTLIVWAPSALFIGLKCYGRAQDPGSLPVSGAPTDIRGYVRAEAFTFLTLPEWFIVYSAEEYARLIGSASPTAFPFLRSVSQYWEYYGAVCEATRPIYPFETGYHVMLGVIGTSFTLEYAVKSLYENTVGRVTSWFGSRTEEDLFAARVAADYAAFMHTTPWFEFAFSRALRQLWTEVPVYGSQPLRKLERRLALSLEYGGKGVYGWLIGMASGTAYGPEDLIIHARVGHQPDGFWRDRSIVRVREVGEADVVQLPRYEAFTKAALGLIDSGVRFIDIAGNDQMLLTAVAPASMTEQWGDDAAVVASLPILTSPQQKRLAIRVAVARLHEVIPALRSAGATIEHLYDY